MLNEKSLELDNIFQNFKNMQSIIDATIDKQDIAVEYLKNIEDEQLDLMHEISLGNSKDIQGGYKIYKRLREILQIRYKLKDFIDINEEFYEYLKIIKIDKSKIMSLKSNAENRKEKLSKRTYTPRIREDLTVPKKQTKKEFENIITEYKIKNKILKSKKYL